MPIFRPRKFTFFPFLILFKRIESIDMTPCVISFLVNFCILHLLTYYLMVIENSLNRTLSGKDTFSLRLKILNYQHFEFVCFTAS